MKQEVKDIALELLTKTAPAGGMAIWANVSFTAILTAILVCLQILYLVRKWWREETEWGLKLRRWAERQGFTKPADLDD